MADWLKLNPSSNGLKDYRDTDKKNRMLEIKAEDLDDVYNPALRLGTKLTITKSGSGTQQLTQRYPGYL